MQYSDYSQQDATGLADLIRKKEASPLELLEVAVRRAEKVNPQITAVVQKHYDLAKDAITKGLPEGPLYGVPFLLKDISVELQGTVTSKGSRLFSNMISEKDSTLVSRYKKAGLVIFGKTNTPEMGLAASTETALFGSTKNPWNVEHTAGGSSGGSAAAIAAGIVPAAHGSDGGGSIRIPASCCGLFGLKPTRARVPLGPSVGEGWGSMGTTHVLTRSVRDSALFLDVSHGAALGDPYYAPPFSGSYVQEVSKNPGKLRIGLQTSPLSGVPVHEDCLKAVAQTAALLEKLGHLVEEVSPLGNYSEIAPASWALVASNVYATLNQRALERGQPLTETDVEPVTWNAIQHAKGLSIEAYPNALQTIHSLGRKMAHFHEKYDILLSPTLAQPPVKLGPQSMSNRNIDEYTHALLGFTPFTNIENMTGQPSMSVPLFWNEAGLPIGSLFSAAVGREDLLLRLASQLETESPWFDKISPLLSQE